MPVTDQEKAICEAIADAIKTSKPKKKIAAVAAAIGVTENVLSHVMRKKTKPDPDLVDRIRAELNLKSDWPDSALPQKAAREGRRISLAGTPMAPIKIVGHVAAGAGVSNIDIDEGQMYVPERLAQIGGLGWIVDGESMMPALEPGDIAIFKEQRTPRRGYPFLLKYDGEFRVKNIEWDGKQWIMKSLNPEFEPEPLGFHELLGILVGWYKAKGTRETLDSDASGLKLE